MKKINIFNRNTNSPSYRGTGPRKNVPSFRGNAESPRCCRELVCDKTDGIPLFSGMTAVIFALFVATPSFAAPTELDKKTVASKAYVDTKQDIIETGLVEYTDAEEQIDYNVPALVSYGTGNNNVDGVLGNKIGIVGINENMGGLNSYDFLDIWDDEESGYLDNFVPTVRAVSNALAGINGTINDQWQILDALSNPFTWDSNTFPAAINAYSTTFDSTSTHVNGNWPYNQQGRLVPATTFANSLALKQNKIPAESPEMGSISGNAGTLVAATDEDGVVSQRLIIPGYKRGSASGELGAVMNQITPGEIWSMDPGEFAGMLDDIYMYFNDGNGAGYDMQYSVPSMELALDWVNDIKDEFALKQNKLPAQNNNLILDQQTGTGWASVLAPTTAGNVTQIGLWDAAGMDAAYWDLEGTYDTTEKTKIIKSIPTVGAVQAGLKRVMPAKYTGNEASTGGQTIELGATAGHPSVRYITAGGSQPLTQKTGADNVILYINGTKTLAQYQTSNFGGTGSTATAYQNYINGALVSLELLKDVYSELNAKITNNALPTGTTGTVVTYNGVNAETGVQEFGERAVYDPANAYNAQNDATKLATMASVKYECAGYEAGHENDPDYCWLWALPN